MWKDGLGRVYPDHIGDDAYDVDEVTEQGLTRSVMVNIPRNQMLNENAGIHRQAMAFYGHNEKEFWRIICRMACTLAEADDNSEMWHKNKVHQAILNMLGYAMINDGHMYLPDQGGSIRDYLLYAAKQLRPYLYTGFWKELNLAHQTPAALFFTGKIYVNDPGY